MKKSVRIDSDLYDLAKSHANAERRTIAGQIEFWARVLLRCWPPEVTPKPAFPKMFKNRCSQPSEADIQNSLSGWERNVEPLWREC